MKLITVELLRLDGEKCEKVSLGKLALDPERLIHFGEVTDKWDVIVPDVLGICDRDSHHFLIRANFEDFKEQLELLDVTS